MNLKRTCSILMIFLGGILFTRSVNAQYTDNFQTNVISGVTSNWSGDYVLGSNTYADVLLIEDGAALSDGNGVIGYRDRVNGGNMVVVSGSGSVWDNSGILYAGFIAANNTLIITNGGAVYSAGGSLGYQQVSDNLVVITGSGSVWSNSGDLVVGGPLTSFNSVIISDGGAMYNNDAVLGLSGPDGFRNSVVVTGDGSVWNTQNLSVFGGNNTVIVTNGGFVHSTSSDIGDEANDSVVVTGKGSEWDSGPINITGVALASLIISDGGVVHSDGAELRSNTRDSVLVTGAHSLWDVLDVRLDDLESSMTVDHDGTVKAGDVYISSSSSLTVNDGGSLFATSVNNYNETVVSGGALWATNGLGTGGLAVNGGTFTLDGGVVTADQLSMITNSADSVESSISFEFTSGMLNSGGTFVTNGQTFVVGDGTNGAVFELMGGFHSFADGLEISRHAFLTGCGTIDGSVVVDPGGQVLTYCGDGLTFSGIVTNNGAMRATNRSAFESYGTFVNNGTIKGALVFHGVVNNHGTVLSVQSIGISVIAVCGKNVVVQAPSQKGFQYDLEVSTSGSPNWTRVGGPRIGTGRTLTFVDGGGATKGGSRVYRLGVTKRTRR